MKTTAFLIAALCIAGCDQSKPAADGTATASAPPVASASAAPEPEAPWFEGKWAGTYDAKHYLIEMKKKNGAQPAWEKDDGGTASGEGKFTLEMDEKGVVTGSAEGPLGPMDVSGGLQEEKELSLRLRSKTPDEESAQVFNGYVLAQKKGEGFEGTLRASSGDSLTVRDAKVVLKRSE